jgi:hypothetical protein
MKSSQQIISFLILIMDHARYTAKMFQVSTRSVSVQRWLASFCTWLSKLKSIASQKNMYNSSSIQSFKRSTYVIIPLTQLWLASNSNWKAISGSDPSREAWQFVSTHCKTSARTRDILATQKSRNFRRSLHCIPCRLQENRLRRYNIRNKIQIPWKCRSQICGLFIKVKLSMRLLNYAPRHENVWGSGGISPPFLEVSVSKNLIIRLSRYIWSA